MRKGWFRITGVQDGDRDPVDQLAGCELALAEAAGATVLDLGCAEGCIAAAFAHAGASVVAIDVIADHLEVARRLWAGLRIHFLQADLATHAAARLESGDIERFDIVLALGVPHKIANPGVAIEFAARSARRLVLLRTRPDGEPYFLAAKRKPNRSCQVDEIMAAQGFVHADTLPPGGNRVGEAVQYWRRRT